MSWNGPQPHTAGRAANDHDAQLYADAERHRLATGGAEDGTDDGSEPAPSWLARLKQRLGSRRADD